MMQNVMEMLAKFLENGLNIQSYGFRELSDKKNFFEMYKEFTLSLNKGEQNIHFDYTPEYDLVVEVNGDLICSFTIDYGYRTLSAETLYNMSDERLVFLLSCLFLTIKELSNMINNLQDMISKQTGFDKAEKPTSVNKKYSNIPMEVKRSINKIEKLQSDLLKQSKSFKTTVKNKESE
tara:strand:- start:383 stop:916 length:534 start_codon:yes stop_codon:yes gene_type:complete